MMLLVASQEGCTGLLLLILCKHVPYLVLISGGRKLLAHFQRFIKSEEGKKESALEQTFNSAF